MPDQIRAAVERAVPYVEEKGEWWIKEKKCASCHRTGPMVWSLGFARERELIKSERLNAWYSDAIDEVLQKKNEDINGATNKDGVAQLLLARPLFDRDSKRADDYRRLRAMLVAQQQADGIWKPDGQLPGQKRPKEETATVGTMWIVAALLSGEPNDAERAAIDKAVEHIRASSPGKSTEWFAARLLLARQMKDAETVRALSAKLREQQQADGGFGWLVGGESDALGTGLALFALSQSGAAADDPAVQKAQQFLITTQRDDGSWAVKGTKENKKQNVEETAIFWGTAWAVQSLAASLPSK